MMDIGNEAPELLGLDQDGQEVRLSEYEGMRLLLYFYPKDNTPGCTAQACSLRDGFEELRDRGIAVVGVSKDGAKSHQRFRSAHNLPFRLISDTDHELQKAFGVWVEKRQYGRTYMGTERTSFLIGTDGRIEHIIRGRSVDTKAHTEQILALLEA